MTAYVILKLVTVAASLMMGATIISRDPGFRVNRLMGGVAICTAWWALCEVLWSVETDPVVAARLIRASSLAWLLVGPIFFDVFVELVGSHRSRLHRLEPVVYGLAALGVLLYTSTPWCLVRAVRVDWGWGFEFGPVFPATFFIASIPPTLALLNWRALYPLRGSGGEPRVSRAVVVGVSLAVLVTSATDAVLPFFGVQVPALGSTAIALASLAIAVRLRRYGYSLLSAGAFASEILEAASAGVVLLHPDGRVRDCNAAFERLCGLRAEALRGEPIADRIPALVDTYLSRHCAGESELVHAGGERIPVLVSCPVLCRARERVLGAALLVRDLREIVDLRRQLATSTRLAAVGDLSAEIADEIIAPVRSARGRLADLLVSWRALEVQIEKAGPTPELRGILKEGEEMVDECLEGLGRISAIARDVGGFARRSSAEREPTDVVRLVERAIRVALPRARPGQRIERELDDVPRVLCAPGEMEQVLVNLLVNAFHAVGENGEVRVATECRGSRVWIHVQDDGCGIDSESLDRIFDPFFTTKAVGEGTGLGLPISYQIVESHGGKIQIATRCGMGSTFSVELAAL